MAQYGLIIRPNAGEEILKNVERYNIVDLIEFITRELKKVFSKYPVLIMIRSRHTIVTVILFHIKKILLEDFIWRDTEAVVRKCSVKNCS